MFKGHDILNIAPEVPLCFGKLRKIINQSTLWQAPFDMDESQSLDVQTKVITMGNFSATAAARYDALWLNQSGVIILLCPADKLTKGFIAPPRCQPTLPYFTKLQQVG